MVLHIVNSNAPIKELNKEFLKKKKKDGVNKVRVSKKEGAKEAMPLCRTIESLTSTNSVARNQVGWGMLLNIVSFTIGTKGHVGKHLLIT